MQIQKGVAFIIFLMDIKLQVVTSVDWCSVCKDSSKMGSHTMCQYSDDEVSPCTLINIDKMKKKLLAAHNTKRDKVACFREEPQPPAADMMRLFWDKELQEVAERWAKQCTDGHDECRDVERFSVGQNFAAHSDNIGSDMVQMWFDEVKDVKPEDVKKYAFKDSTGHYTQMVWAKTQYIGCAYVDNHAASGSIRYKLYCNYGPAGNVQGDPIYQVGEPRSKCPSGADKDKLYEGLCCAVTRIAPAATFGTILLTIVLRRIAADHGTSSMLTVGCVISIVVVGVYQYYTSHAIECKLHRNNVISKENVTSNYSYITSYDWPQIS